MDKETMTQYGWILISSIVIAIIMMFATPFGNTIVDSGIKLVKGQTDKADSFYSEENQAKQQEDMNKLFNFATLLSAGIYERGNTEPEYTWDELVANKFVSVLYDGIEKDEQTTKMSGELIVADDVLYINDYALMNCSKLKTVRLGAAIKRIGAYSLYSCSELDTFISNDCLESIKENAFGKCSNLTEVYFTDSLQKINTHAFWGCVKLKKIYFQGTVEEWNNVDKVADWCEPSLQKIVCTDGIVENK